MKLISIQDLYFLSVIILIKALSLSPSAKLKESVTNGIAYFAYHVSRKKRRLSEKNISETLPGEITESRKQEIVKGNFYEFWKDTLSLSPSDNEKAALKRVELRGIGHLRKALEKGKGVILWENNSFGRRNLAKQVLHEKGFSVHQVHTERHIAGFQHEGHSFTWVKRHIAQPFFEKRERQFISDIIYLPPDSLVFTRRLLERLKQNAVVCARIDISYGQKLIPQKLFGHTKFFPTGMISLAKISGAPLLPIFCIQERDGKTALIIESPIRIGTEINRDQSIENGIAEYIRLLESYVRRYPEKYHGWHFLDKAYENQFIRIS